MINRVYNGHYKIEKESETGHERLVSTDAVAALVYVKDTDEFIFTRQERFPAHSRIDGGSFFETVAGSRDYNVSILGLIKNELAEEILAREKSGDAYVPSVRDEQITLLNDCHYLHSSPGRMTEGVILAYVEICSSQIEDYGDNWKICGLACETEHIRRSFMPRKVALSSNIVWEDLKIFALIQWFKNYHHDKVFGSICGGLSEKVEDHLAEVKQRLEDVSKPKPSFTTLKNEIDMM